MDEPNNKGRKFKQVHKMDENKSTKWTDLTRVKTTVRNEDGPNDKGRKITKSTKWTNPTKGQDSSHKVDGVYKGSRPVHNVDGPNKGRKT